LSKPLSDDLNTLGLETALGEKAVCLKDTLARARDALLVERHGSDKLVREASSLWNFTGEK